MIKNPTPIPSRPRWPIKIPSNATAIAEYARQTAKKYGIDPEIFLSQIWQESRFRPGVYGPPLPNQPRFQGRVQRAAGIVQFIETTWVDIRRKMGKSPDVNARLNPQENIEASAFYMRKLLDQFGGSYEAALSAYNAGPGITARTIRQFGRIPNITETKNYVREILANSNILKRSNPSNTSNNSGGISGGVGVDIGGTGTITGQGGSVGTSIKPDLPQSEGKFVGGQYAEDSEIKKATGIIVSITFAVLLLAIWGR